MRRCSSWSFRIACVLSLVACNSKPSTKPASPAASAALAAASASARLPPPKRHNWPMPSGPMLAVVAGQGVGPIRIGATTATIERLMELPCEVKTESLCRYVARGVEFNLEGGVTKSIYVQRAGRPTKDAQGNDTEFGFFKGAIPPDLRLGMVPKAIQEYLHEPSRVEKSGEAGTANKVETHFYDGMMLEYDRIENGNLVLGGIVIFKSDTLTPPTAEKKSAPDAKSPAPKSSATKPK